MGLLCAGGDPALSGCGEVVAYVRSGSNVIFLGYGTEAQKWRLSAELIPKKFARFAERAAQCRRFESSCGREEARSG